MVNILVIIDLLTDVAMAELLIVILAVGYLVASKSLGL
jgi:hypothetical protein